MIVVDIETSGGPALDRYGIWQIGALDLETGAEFLEEGKIDEKDEVVKEALEITGKTEKELRDKSKQTQKQLIKNFLKWLEKRENRSIVCLHPQFDVAFLWLKMGKYGLKSKHFGSPDYQRCFDLHTFAQLVYYLKNKKFLMKEDHSNMGLRNILNMFGIKDERKQNKNGKITEGKPHNALEDCKLETLCFKKLLEELEK